MALSSGNRPVFSVARNLTYLGECFRYHRFGKTLAKMSVPHPEKGVNETSSLLSSRPNDHEAGIVENGADKREAMRKILYSIALTTIFFFVELVGGYIAGSLAIVSDAAHMLSDLAGMLISLAAIWLARYPPTDTMSFGYERAQVIGALFSLIFIWVITGFLIVSAIMRFLYPTKVKGPLMVLLGSIGLAINLLIGLVLGHGHVHLHDHDHSAHHSHDHDHNQDHGHSNGHDHDHHSKDDGHNHSRGGIFSWDRITGAFIQDPNIRAAFIHVAGDALLNIGVIIAGMVITMRPTWNFVDPACTLVFAGVVFMTTKDLALKMLRILMEGVPDHISLPEVREKLQAIRGVRAVMKLRAWSIGIDTHKMAVHLAKDKSENDRDILASAKTVLENEFKISDTIVQITH